MMTGYKLFEKRAGNYYPLFIDCQNPLKTGISYPAENHPTKGFAKRPGWHIGTIPDAPWLKGYDGSETGPYKSKYRHGKRVWCEVDYSEDIDYDPQVADLPKKCLTDKIPEGGFYTFREAGKGVWIIAGEMKIIREISEAERQEILLAMEYDERAEYEKYKRAFEKRKTNRVA